MRTRREIALEASRASAESARKRRHLRYVGEIFAGTVYGTVVNVMINELRDLGYTVTGPDIPAGMRR